MKRPQTPHDIQVFNGLAQFNQCFIWNSVRIMEPITLLMRQLVKFNWSDPCAEAWEQIKKCYFKAPTLTPPRWDLEFHVHTDASNIAIGAMLAQNPTGKCDQPILYASQLLTSAKQNYTTTERDALAMVYALQKFWYYLLSNKVIFYVDHITFTYIVNKPQPSGWVARCWCYYLSLTFQWVTNPGRPMVPPMPSVKQHRGPIQN